MTEPTKPSFTVLRALQSDSLLADTTMPSRVEALLSVIPYDLGDNHGPQEPANVLQALQKSAASIPQMRLERSLTPGAENAYHVDLTFTYEQIVSQSQRVAVLATAFLGHLRACHARLAKFEPVFGIWWMLGAKEVLNADPVFKGLLTDKQLAVLATDELSQYLEERDVEIEAVIDATTMLVANIKAGLKQAETTYQLGRDQINLSLADYKVPTESTPGRSPRTYTNQEPAASLGALQSVFGDRVQTPAPAEQDDEFPLVTGLDVDGDLSHD